MSAGPEATAGGDGPTPRRIGAVRRRARHDHGACHPPRSTAASGVMSRPTVVGPQSHQGGFNCGRHAPRCPCRLPVSASPPPDEICCRSRTASAAFGGERWVAHTRVARRRGGGHGRRKWSLRPSGPGCAQVTTVTWGDTKHAAGTSAYTPWADRREPSSRMRRNHSASKIAAASSITATDSPISITISHSLLLGMLMSCTRSRRDRGRFLFSGNRDATWLGRSTSDPVRSEIYVFRHIFHIPLAISRCKEKHVLRLAYFAAPLPLRAE